MYSIRRRDCKRNGRHVWLLVARTTDLETAVEEAARWSAEGTQYAVYCGRSVVSGPFVYGRDVITGRKEGTLCRS